MPTNHYIKMCDYLSNLTQDKIDLLLEDSKKNDSVMNKDDVVSLSEMFKAVLNDPLNKEKHHGLQLAKDIMVKNTHYTRFRL